MLKIFMLIIVLTLTQGSSIDLKISCDGNAPLVQQPRDRTENVAGSPGKRGPIGPQGPPGPVGVPGECGCTEIENMKERIQALENVQILQKPFDCSEVSWNGNNKVRTIYPFGSDSEGFQVYCKDKWTVFQRRFDGSVDFYRTLQEYEDGFGTAGGEYWLGLNKIYKMTSQAKYKLKIHLHTAESENLYANYGSFSIGTSVENYPLKVSHFSGDHGDSLAYHNNLPFTTKDADHDNNPVNCANIYKGGWWYDSCHHSNLNGLYNGKTSVGISWYDWKNSYIPMKTSMMMIKRVED